MTIEDDPIREPDEKKRYPFAVRQPVTIAMLFLTLAVFGYKSYEGLPINLMPDISYPTLTVRTEYEGAAPEDVEKLVTRPLEETLSIVSGMAEISSVSSPGLSEIVLEFNWGTDMNVAQQDVRDRLDLFDAPREITEKPVILRYDPKLDPILRIAITPERPAADQTISPALIERQLTELREAAERHVKSDLEAEIGIAQVLVKGGREREIQIRVDSERLKALGLSLSEVNTALSQQNINLSGGSLREGKAEYLVRTKNEWDEATEIRDTILRGPQGRQVRLVDVAEVVEGEKERTTIVHVAGQEAVALEIYKEGDANTVQVCNKLKDLFGFERGRSLTERIMRKVAELRMTTEAQIEQAHQDELAKTLRSRLPKGANLAIISDQSRFIIGSIKEVQNATLQGGLLALAVLYLFLRDMKSTLIIGVSIPLSVIVTFVPMFARGITLNIMSLGGLALGVGMLVDNSIVVLESIFRCREEGDGPVDAVARGTKEIAAAVTSSTLTTVAVFFPIAFVEGIAGQLFGDLALTVTFSLLASLLAALYLVPMIASRGKTEFIYGAETVWMLRAFRELRGQDGLGPGAAFLGTLPRGMRHGWTWVKETAAAELGVCVTLFAKLKIGFLLLFPIKLVLSLIAILLTLPRGMRHGWTWVKETAATELGVCVSLFAKLRIGALLLFPIKLVFFLIVSVCSVTLFLVHVILKVLAALAITLLFAICVLAGAVFFILRTVFKAVTYLPLEAFNICFEAFRDGYAALLRRLLPLSAVFLVAMLLLSVQAGRTAMTLGRELIPPMKQGEFGIRMEAPPGTRIDETDLRARKIEGVLRENTEVDTVTVEIGSDKTRVSSDRGENVAQFTVLLKNPKDNAQRQDAIIDGLRSRIAQLSSDTITFTLPTLFSFKSAVEMEIRGDDLAELKRVGTRALEAIKDVKGVKDAELSVKRGYPEIVIVLDRDLLAAKGLSAFDVATRLRAEVQGEVATRLSEEGEKVDVRVRADQRRLKSLDDLKNLSIVPGKPPIPLRDIARITVEDGPSEIRRIDQRQVVLVTANVTGIDLNAVSKEIERRLRNVEKPADYEFALSGQNRELEVSYDSLRFALLLAVFLVYVVMACQFESLLHPAIVMFTVPMALIGVVYALKLTGISISVTVFIGGIVLVGIVVNNAIVLVDYVNQLRSRGMAKRDALVLAGKVRLRPILMTTITTVLGLIPMAFYSGEGAEMRQPMAITVMAGLSTATVLTLVIIPMVYYLFGGRDKTVMRP